MIVVCDTSPIAYLLLIEEITLLPRLFGRVTIPTRVHQELLADGAPPIVRRWAMQPPDWLTIREALIVDLEPALYDLDAGEQEALALALRLRADLVLLDDLPARKVAVSLGLRITGLLGVLDLASDKGMVDLVSAVARLERTNFRIAPRLLQTLLRRHLD